MSDYTPNLKMPLEGRITPPDDDTDAAIEHYSAQVRADRSEMDEIYGENVWGDLTNDEGTDLVRCVAIVYGPMKSDPATYIAAVKRLQALAVTIDTITNGYVESEAKKRWTDA